ncbi:hypothetical protein AVR78_13125 [Klebsiella quasipneumoniae]|nr:hypothetical protein AVR78_13125 [Klebsiella quasipneumoniae]
MELTNSDIAIRERIYSQRDNVNHHLLALLILTQAVTRQTTISKHVVNGVDRQPGQLAITFDCDVRRIQSD